MLQKDTIQSYQNDISMPHTESGSYNSKYLMLSLMARHFIALII